METELGRESLLPKPAHHPSRVGEGLHSLPLAGRPLHLYKEGQGSLLEHTSTSPPNPSLAPTTIAAAAP